MARPIRIRIRLAIVAALCAAFLDPAIASDIERQRELFKVVFEPAERGDWSAFEALPVVDKRMLSSYVLWPDLRAAYLRATMRNAKLAEIEAFLDSHGTLKPARELRYRYALELSRRNKLDRYHDIYESFYQGLEIAKLDCIALQAELFAGRSERIVKRGKALWRIGKSQVDECDPVFEYLRSQSLLTAKDYIDRYKLAIDEREFSLARWIGKSIDQLHVEKARLWLSARSNPERFLRTHASRESSESARAQLAYAAERLTFSDPELAHELWSTVSMRYGFSEEQKHRTARHIALWTARDGLRGGYDLLSRLPRVAQDEEVMRWRARTSLRRDDWLALLTDIREMNTAEKESDEWRYWRAIALMEIGQVNTAEASLGQLATERSYYGFLAADVLGQPYAFEHSSLVVDETLLDAISARPALVRARELFLVGLDGRGRSEWDAATSYLSENEKKHAAVLADRWGWHSRAISLAASIGEYDDLTLRYPLPYRGEFERHATSARIAPTWAYGIARSESLFMRDVRSGAGAVGLMQLMPSTGRSVARQLNLPYAGLDTLTDPQANIRLGTTYLAQMAERYAGNRVLATAAYNAGPHRVDRWKPVKGSIDARVWIENIPFNETRGYVRRVMAAETIFHWRLNGTTRRLSDTLAAISADDGDQRVASASR